MIKRSFHYLFFFIETFYGLELEIPHIEGEAIENTAILLIFGVSFALLCFDYIQVSHRKSDCTSKKNDEHIP